MFSNLTHIAFADKWVLWLIPVAVVIAALWWLFREKKTYPTLKLSSTEAFAGMGTPLKATLKKITPGLRVFALIMLLVAIARPQTTSDEEKVTTDGIDIVLAMDVSASMLSKDFSPNRIEAAKKVASDFIDGRPYDRIGLVIFSGESFTQCPITIDHAVLKNQLKEIKNGLLEDGTAIGMGLGTAVDRLKDGKAKSKVVILMTDGVNNRGLIDPLTATDIAIRFGVRVYTIGIGTNGKALTPVAMGPDGKLIFDYAPVEIDEGLLKNIAQKTGGQYFRATDNKSLKAIYAQIDKMEKTKIQVAAFQHKSEKFYVFALLAALALLLEMLMRYVIVKSIP
ncbi:MAG TPA: VWA domain-containing protein [Chitinophagales bacterium]|nr:VWA domain-containing protein [Chitinophagales bacterium]